MADDPVTPTKTPHARAAEDILAELGTRADTGLDVAEARARLRSHGPNVLRARKPASLWRILRNQFESPVVLLLAAAALVAFTFGEWKEAGAIAAVLVINGAIGFTTELRALRSMEALRVLGSMTTRARRDGHAVAVAAEEIVPGDIVLLEGGDVVSADLRLVEASNLSADESALTGESVAVSKRTAPVPANAVIGDRASMVFKGTAITRGSGVGVVVATGMESELGAISKLVEEAAPEHSPLERQLERLSGHLIRFTLLVVALIGTLGILSGKDTFLMIEAAIALAVAAIPEGLPIVATMALARGMWRMARHNALIERLAAVETLGATTVIFTDKTGTLTENRMELQEIDLPAGRIEIADDPPRILAEDRTLAPEDVPGLAEALRVALLCNNAELDDTDAGGTGDPLEIALLRAGAAGDMDKARLAASLPRTREVAFDTDSKMMATVHGAGGGHLVLVKGAPEAVLDHATHILGASGAEALADEAREAWAARTGKLAGRGLRVLAVAMKETADPDAPAYGDLVFIGLLGLRDPPREDVPAAIARCHRAGIRVVMITGDHAVTARNIASAIGLADANAEVLEGRDLKPLDTLSEDDLERLRRARVFARVSPAQKLDLISVYQAAGEIVAMTGDGVNDAPALKKADIGVAMGLRGTQVAREAAAMVLRDDAFSTIVAAIREGRVIFRNIQRFVTYLLSCNLSEVLIVGLAILVNLPLPLLPLQILFLNLVTDVFPAFALGVGEGGSHVLDRPPRDPSKPILSRALWTEIIGHGFSITLATLGALIVAREVLVLEGDAAVTISFLTLAFAQLWHVFNMRDPRSGAVVNSITRNGFVWLALALCTGLILTALFVPAIADVLRLHNPAASGWLVVLAMSAVPLLIGQIGKEIAARLWRRRHG